jgi:DNA-binding beta-propeller fold protein YncE
VKISTGLIKRVLLATGISLVLLIAGGLEFLAYPAEPSASRVVHFDGYILLPKHGLLNVLDYLTLSNQTLFVTGASSGSVFRISLDPRRPASESSVLEWQGAGRVHGVALVPSRNLAFVTRSGENSVDAFDPSTLKLLGRIQVADDPDAILYDRGSNTIYVANGDAQTGTLIDPDKRTKVAAICLEGKPEFAAIDPVSQLLYQNIEDTDALVAINLVKRSVVGRWPLWPCQGPTGVAIDYQSRRLFVVCSRNSIMIVFDLIQHKIVSSLEIGSGADSVAIDPSLHRIYSTGLDGKLTIVQQDTASSYRVIDRISTHFGAHTLAVDPVSHKIYVAYASLFVAPRIAVFSVIH